MNFSDRAKKKKIQIIPELTEDIAIKIDPIALDRILNNLLDNAIKYIQPKGKIWIKTSKKKL